MQKARAYFQVISLPQLNMLPYKYEMKTAYKRARFGGTYTKIGTIQRRLAWPLRKDDTQNREAFHIFLRRVSMSIVKVSP